MNIPKIFPQITIATKKPFNPAEPKTVSVFVCACIIICHALLSVMHY